MSKKANTAMIGAFVIGAVILAVVGILAFGSGALFKDVDTFVLFFEGDLQGLSVGAPVLFRGVRVGQVVDIRVLYSTGETKFLIPVTIETEGNRFHEMDAVPGEIPEEIEATELDRLIKSGLRAQLTLQSLVTGQLAISLGLLPDTPVNMRGDGSVFEIPTVPSSFERLAEAFKKLDLPKLAENINAAVEDLGNLIDEGGIEELVADIRMAAQEIAGLAREMRGSMPVMAEEIQMTAQSARSMMGTIERQVDPVADEAVDTMAEIRARMVQAKKTLTRIEKLTADYSADSDFGYELSVALNEIAATARSVRALTDMLEQQPDALLRGKTGSEGN